METLRKHAGIIAVGVAVAVGSYFIGVHSGKSQVPAALPSLENQMSGQPTSIDFSPFWKAWNTINDKYVPASTTKKQITDQDKVYGAIKGLAASLGDPYTVFFPPVENSLFESDIKGNFEGVGMEVLAQDGAITVIAPLKGSPAESAGMKAGDRIIKIDGKDASNLTTEDAVQLIRGPQGTSVDLTVVRSGVKAPFDISVERQVIDIPTIDTEKLPGGIFKISLYSFTQDSPNLFRGALREFVQSGDSKLILDLRGNPGGYLDAAIDMASWFLPSDAVVVREDFGGRQDPQVYKSKGYDIFNDNLKFVILVDGGSASASEILSGALQQNHRATLVGEQTFGKGSVQELVQITPETSLKVTVARWLTPNGTSISEKGVTPDYVVPMTEKDREAGKDPQLDEAVKLLSQ